MSCRARVRHRLDDSEAYLFGQAVEQDCEAFRQRMIAWVAVVDEDGAHRGHDRADRDRRAHASIVGDRFYLNAAGGVVDGTMVNDILEAFAKAEWFADWEAGVAEHGDMMYPGLMARTDAQRRYDAMTAVFITAATKQAPTTTTQPDTDTDTEVEPDRAARKSFG